jgi:hypothetical protein
LRIYARKLLLKQPFNPTAQLAMIAVFQGQQCPNLRETKATALRLLDEE